MKDVAVADFRNFALLGHTGSGKTTLLKRALSHELERGVKPAVLMNEFGAVPIDQRRERLAVAGTCTLDQGVVVNTIRREL